MSGMTGGRGRTHTRARLHETGRVLLYLLNKSLPVYLLLLLFCVLFLLSFGTTLISLPSLLICLFCQFSSRGVGRHKGGNGLGLAWLSEGERGLDLSDFWMQ